MNSALLTVIIPLFWIKGISPKQSQHVHQTPADLLGAINAKVKLTCKHTINNYDTILWYHSSQGDSSLKLVGFTSYTTIQTVEKSFEGSFNVSGNGEKEAFLHLLKLRHPKDSGHYFCAAYSLTTIEKTQLPLQKPLCHPVHLEQTTFVESAKQWEELKKKWQEDGQKHSETGLVLVLSYLLTSYPNSSWFVTLNMIRPHLVIPIIIWIKGVSLSKETQVLQTSELLRPLNDEVKMTCTHENPHFNTILWYQRSKGDSALKLIGYVYYKSPSVEPSFQGHFNVSGNGENNAYLHIQRLIHPEHSAEYFCAARYHSGEDSAPLLQKPGRSS